MYVVPVGGAAQPAPHHCLVHPALLQVHVEQELGGSQAQQILLPQHLHHPSHHLLGLLDVQVTVQEGLPLLPGPANPLLLLQLLLLLLLLLLLQTAGAVTVEVVVLLQEASPLLQGLEGVQVTNPEVAQTEGGEGDQGSHLHTRRNTWKESGYMSCKQHK